MLNSLHEEALRKHGAITAVLAIKNMFENRELTLARNGILPKKYNKPLCELLAACVENIDLILAFGDDVQIKKLNEGGYEFGSPSDEMIKPESREKT